LQFGATTHRRAREPGQMRWLKPPYGFARGWKTSGCASAFAACVGAQAPQVEQPLVPQPPDCV
jgi:hypothetical protein